MRIETTQPTRAIWEAGNVEVSVSVEASSRQKPPQKDWADQTYDGDYAKNVHHFRWW
jgi:hypothetical protein